MISFLVLAAGCALELAQPAVVLPVQASDAQRYAAEELRDYIGQMTGARLTITNDAAQLPAQAILIGETRHTDGVLGGAVARPDAKGDGFRLIARPPHLVILGSAERGCLYGAYELLERFGGCRWYSSWRTKVPRGKVLSVPGNLDELSEPAFAMREPFWWDVRAHAAFAARLRVNRRLGRKNEARFGGNPWIFDDVLTVAHTFYRLLPPERHFAAHPEYFSEVKGKRLRSFGQLCLTNPDVLKIVTSNVLARIEQNPNAAFYGISQNDWQGRCQCAACKAVEAEEGSAAGPVVRFLNAIAKAVDARFPGKVLETLAYQYSRKPPTKTRLLATVVPCLCSIECDFGRPLDAANSSVNRSFLRDLHGWAAQTKDLYVWDYATDFRDYTAPFANVFVLQDNLKLFRANHVRYLFSQGDGQAAHANFAELKAWLTAKWMWNPDLPMEELLSDFLPGYYGAGAPAVRRYLDRLHACQSRLTTSLTCYQKPGNPALSDAFLEETAADLAAAERLCADDPDAAYAVRMTAFGVKAEILERLRRTSDKLLVMTDKPLAASARLQPLARELLADMEKAKKRGNAIRLAESQEWNESMISAWRSLATSNGVRRTLPTKCGVLQETAFDALRKGPKGWCTVTNDVAAQGGQAIALFNTHNEWCLQLPLERIAFEPGRRYTVRVRVRAEEPEESANPVVLAGGVYNRDPSKGSPRREFRASELAGAYRWVTLGSWQPNEDDLLWLAPGGPAANARPNGTAFVDAVEFSDASE